MDPYSTLEVPHTATIEEIKKAYRRMALKWHPDKNGGSLDAAEIFRNVKAAYDCLIDPIRRATADADRRKQEQSEAAKKVSDEAAWQTRTQAHTQPQPGRFGNSPWVVFLALIALVIVIATLFSSSKVKVGSTTA